ncbi:transcriptional regulator, partial [Erwinia amylovora]|uniref:LysR family transcriptional regulator n=1 Tax=Erwinia amylovora TaxID=552 RepID=UPI0037BF1078|nr:transcriptional regulator [Erwinia amylovora]
MERLKGWSDFTKGVEGGTDTAAAQQMQLSVSAGSQIGARLEIELRGKLLYRSTRDLGLREAGQMEVQGCGRR